MAIGKKEWLSHLFCGDAPHAALNNGARLQAAHTIGAGGHSRVGRGFRREAQPQALPLLVHAHNSRLDCLQSTQDMPFAHAYVVGCKMHPDRETSVRSRI